MTGGEGIFESDMNDGKEPEFEKQKHTLDLHADIGKTLITASSIVLTIIVVFAGKEIFNTSNFLSQLALTLALLLILFCITLSLVANQKIIGISKKISATEFQSDKMLNSINQKEYWNTEIKNAAVFSNLSWILFSLGAFCLVLFVVILQVPGNNTPETAWSSLKNFIEASQNMKIPLSWTNVSRNDVAETFRFTVEDVDKKRLVCEVTFTSAIKSCVRE